MRNDDAIVLVDLVLFIAAVVGLACLGFRLGGWPGAIVGGVALSFYLRWVK